MWASAKFPLAYNWGVVNTAGYIYRGLGLSFDRKGNKRRRPLWTLSHLGSGHRVAHIEGKVAEAFPIATEIAECGDWDAFEMPSGWRNVDPELPTKLLAIVQRHRDRCMIVSGDPDPNSDDIARMVISLREAGACRLD
jgi:hypothetical protein